MVLVVSSRYFCDLGCWISVISAGCGPSRGRAGTGAGYKQRRCTQVSIQQRFIDEFVNYFSAAPVLSSIVWTEVVRPIALAACAVGLPWESRRRRASHSTSPVFYFTADNVSYGTQVSGLVGGKHLIVDTGRNDLGPRCGCPVVQSREPRAWYPPDNGDRSSAGRCISLDEDTRRVGRFMQWCACGRHLDAGNRAGPGAARASTAGAGWRGAVICSVPCA